MPKKARLTGEVIIAKNYTNTRKTRGYSMGGKVRVHQSKGWRNIDLKTDTKLERGDLIEFDEISNCARNVVKIGRKSR